MGAKNLEQFVCYLAECGIDDNCDDLKKLVEEGRADDIKAHLSSWVREKARNALADNPRESRSDLNIDELTHQVSNDVAELRIAFEDGVDAILEPFDEATLHAFIEHFGDRTRVRRNGPVAVDICYRAQVMASRRRRLREAQRQRLKAEDYCERHECVVKDCADKH
jgi:hypothetical protein